MMSLQRQFRNTTSKRRHGFTLIELLVVITIMLIIFSLTAGVVSLAINTDRIPSSARTIQAAVAGARDRALRAGRDELTQQPKRGIRFVLNPNDVVTNDNNPNSTTVNSLVYVGSQDDWTEGDLTTALNSPNIAGFDWTKLNDAGLSLSGARIKIFEGSGIWYRINSITLPAATTATLTRNYSGSSTGPHKYLLQLPAAVLPNEQPLALDSNVAINLEISRVNGGLPSDWYEEDLPGNPGKYRYRQGNMEVLFTPEGNVAGPLSASAPIYLYLCSMDDALNGRGPDHAESGEKLVIKFSPQTGTLQTFPVNPSATDPFKFAKQ